MKKMIFTLIAIMIFAINYAQIGTHIPENRLPQTEPAWWDANESVLPWQNAGCLESIRANGGLVIDKFIDVQEDLDNPIFGNTITEKINNIVANNTTHFPGQSLLFYFSPGEYEFDETITINRNEIVNN